ncbi:hypothetical protein GGX14DRAFT_570837 [Mycena pura]|uniref:Uncharacterized protein n=1 Tax=Mycena pura TaxID=153505 RepID=A0AAD6V857_9AGAR|nr:hypothetical protein GGX14DRAFT_570837 [Mycena pura]
MGSAGARRCKDYEHDLEGCIGAHAALPQLFYPKRTGARGHRKDPGGKARPRDLLARAAHIAGRECMARSSTRRLQRGMRSVREGDRDALRACEDPRGRCRAGEVCAQDGARGEVATRQVRIGYGSDAVQQGRRHRGHRDVGAALASVDSPRLCPSTRSTSLPPTRLSHLWMSTPTPAAAHYCGRPHCRSTSIFVPLLPSLFEAALVTPFDSAPASPFTAPASPFNFADSSCPASPALLHTSSASSV